MNKGIYILATEKYSGKLLISIGLMEMLTSKNKRIGFFRPIINDEQQKDNNIDVILSHFNIDQSYEDTFAFRKREVLEFYKKEKYDYIIDVIIDKYKKLEARKDFILIEGSDLIGTRGIFEFDINIEIIKSLNFPVLNVLNGLDKSVGEIINTLDNINNSFSKNKIKTGGYIINRLSKNIEDELDQAIVSNNYDCPHYIIPENENLNSICVKDIILNLPVDVIIEKDNLENVINSFLVGAMQLPNFISRLGKNSFIIAPGDRIDIIMGALQANMSNKDVNVVAILLTGGIKLDKMILDLIKDSNNKVTILSTKLGTFKTATRVEKIKSRILSQNKDKIKLSIATFVKYVDPIKIIDIYTKFNKGEDRLNSRMFQYNILKRAKSNKKHILLVEGEDKRILKAAAKLIYQDVVDITLIGNLNNINKKIRDLGINLNLDKINIINNIRDHSNFDLYVREFYNLRKQKNMTMPLAKDYILDPCYFGTMMVYMGDVDGLVSGAINTTQHTIKPSLEIIKTKKGNSIVSSVFFMLFEDKVLVYGDCAVNPNPDENKLAEIAISSANTANILGIEPIIALLSYSSGDSAGGEEVDKIRKAKDIALSINKDLKIEGPIQYDAAVDLAIAKKKLPKSSIAGHANVFIFPNLNTGNNTYKAVQRETGAIAIGPILQGINKPVNDLSRGCSVDDIFNTVIITAIQAQYN